MIEYRITASCVGCLMCVLVCPARAILVTEEGRPFVNMELCIDCEACVRECPIDGGIVRVAEDPEDKSGLGS